MPNRLPPQPTEVIDRTQTVLFTFNGQTIPAHPGDTIASALLAAGVRELGTSTKYLRPRGVLCAAGFCGQCVLQAGDDPMARACHTPVSEGLIVESHQNQPWPGPEAIPGLPPVDEQHALIGFHYKHVPSRADWPKYDSLFRDANGQGHVNLNTPEHETWHEYLHTDVAVVGAGPAGVSAAQTLAALGANIILLDSHAAPNLSHPRLTVLNHTTVTGWYKEQWLAAVRKNQLLKIRARATVIATGAYERPALFENNDLPGVLMGSAAVRLLQQFGVKIGQQAVVLTANDEGYAVAQVLSEAGVEVAAIVDERAEPTRLATPARTLPHCTLIAAQGTDSVTAAVIGPLSGGPSQTLKCDVIVTSVGYSPALELLHHAGGKVALEANAGELLPMQLPAGVFVAGSANGVPSAEVAKWDGILAGYQAAHALGFTRSLEQLKPLAATIATHKANARRSSPLPIGEGLGVMGKCFVCSCIDVTAQDIVDSVADGYNHVELIKRYTKFGTGPCQGKLCGFTAAALCAQVLGQPLSEATLTTVRQPIAPISFSVLRGQHQEPTQITPVHGWHLAHSAKMMVAGTWLRPLHYGDVTAEVRAVRERVGLIDVSTLGKLRFTGAGAAALLNRLYFNWMDDVKVGRVRYGVMGNDEAVILDDGVTARLSDNEWYTTTTTSGAGTMFEYIQWWMQSGWGEGLHCADLTEAYCAFNLAGPHSRAVLEKLVAADIANAAFPYMAVRELEIAGTLCRVMRIGFTGELSYEIHVPSAFAMQVWEALMDAGQEFGIAPFGVEAQRILRLEKAHIIVGQDTDAMTDPIAADMAWAVKMEKLDFLGKRSLERILREGVAQKLTGFKLARPDIVPEEGLQIVRPNASGKLESIGYITSCKFSPTLQAVIGLCWLPCELAEQNGAPFTIRLQNGVGLETAHVHHGAFYDVAGTKLRS
jgi:sarcosine oxidase subunit alpha